jgi:alpha-L-fucosidase
VRLCRNRLKLVVGDWTAAGSTPLPVGAWTHVVLVRDGDSLRVYLNGVPETLTPPERVDGATGALLPPATDPLPPFSSAKVTFHPSDGAKTNGRFPVLVLGASHDNHQYQAKFIGAVGPLVMENRPWSAAEVAAACNAAAPEGRRLSLRWSVLDDPVGGYSRRPDKVQETSAEYLVRTAWFRKARYGLFMHWNPSSLTKAEISWGRGSEVPADVYDNLYKQFNPTLYRPAQWAADLQAGGMGYAVLTVKHHDGFLMWPSATSTYTIAATPYGKDIAGQYIAAMRAAKVPVGLYYSPRDWWWKADRPEIVGPPETRASIIPYVTAHMRELCGQYGPIDLFWFDGGVGGEAEIYQTVIGPRQPQCLTNDRNGPGDYLTPEGQIPSRPLINPDGSDAVWESCIPMGNGGWSYHHDGAEPYDVLIRQMVEIFAKGGNLLRDIGPRPTGEWSPPVVARIHEIGAWLRTNGRSVYGTHRTRLGAQSWGWTTADRDTLYLHVFHWPGATLVLDNLPDRARSARLLATGKRLRWAQQDHRLTITLPNTAPDLVDTVIAVGIRRR